MPGDALRSIVPCSDARLGPRSYPLGRLDCLQHGEGDGGASDGEKELEGLEKSFEAGVKLAKGHRRVCLECFAPEGTPIQVSKHRCVTASCAVQAGALMPLVVYECCWWRCCAVSARERSPLTNTLTVPRILQLPLKCSGERDGRLGCYAGKRTFRTSTCVWGISQRCAVSRYGPALVARKVPARYSALKQICCELYGLTSHDCHLHGLDVLQPSLLLCNPSLIWPHSYTTASIVGREVIVALP